MSASDWMGEWARGLRCGPRARSAVALPAGAQAPVPEGSEFQVNSHTPNGQTYPSVAMQPGGDFVVAWESYTSPGTDTSASSIQARRFSSDGSALGAQFQVNTYTTGLPAGTRGVGSLMTEPSSWPGGSTDRSGPIRASTPSRAQRFASDGSPQGAQFQVNTYTTFQQRESLGGRGCRRKLRGGVDELPVHSGPIRTATASRGSATPRADLSLGTASSRSTATRRAIRRIFRACSVAADADGAFVVVWDSFGSFGTDTSFLASRANALPRMDPPKRRSFRAMPYTTGHQFRPCVAADDDGDFIVAWDSAGSPGTDTQQL